MTGNTSPSGNAAATAQSPAIETLDLAKRYGDTVALRGLSMEVRRGEVFGFLGPNGAGKTTAVKLLLGLARPSSGQCWILGSDMADASTRRQVGYLPELFRYQDWLSACEVLALHCALAKIPADQRRVEISSALEMVGLAKRGHDRVGTFSKGMQQRLGLGVALLGNPALLFLDEPTSALDPVGRHDVRKIVLDLKNRGVTVFLNSHLLTEVEQVCDRVAIIDRGEVLTIGRIADVAGPPNIVRLRATNVGPEALTNLHRHGVVSQEHAWFTVTGANEQSIPSMVEELVRHGARIYAVEQQRASLEERFLELIKGSERGATDNRPA